MCTGTGAASSGLLRVGFHVSKNAGHGHTSFRCGETWSPYRIFNERERLYPRGHGLRGDLGFYFRRALQGQAALIAADQEVSAKRNHRNEEREPAFRFHLCRGGSSLVAGL